MNRLMSLKLTACAGAMVLLGGCGGGAEDANNAAAPEAVANAAAAPEAAAANAGAEAAPATAAVGGAPTAAYMVGKWSAMDEDCADTLEFRQDGTVMTPIGEGKWTLAGNQLSFEYEGQKMDPSTITVLSQDRIEIAKKSGNKETQIRC